jgi:Domain of unknown function (DUF1883)
VNYLHYDVQLESGGVVEVTLDKQANVRLMDDGNFSNYRSGKKHRYYGGRATKSPVQLAAPHAGHWHVVIDLGGTAGTVRASVRTMAKS